MDMEPTLSTPEALAPVLAELQQLEPLFHAACADASIPRFEQLVSPDFWEVGASGRRYSRAFALSVLAQRQQDPPDESDWRTDQFHLSEAGQDHYLLTYRLHQRGRVTLRLTVWHRHEGGWQALYHQGTVVT